MKIAFIMGLTIVLLAGVWFSALLPKSPNPTLATILFLMIAIPILLWLWIKG